MNHLERYSESQIESRFQALHFLYSNFEHFPVEIDWNLSKCRYDNFKFVDDGVDIYFANGIIEGISPYDFYDYQMWLEYVDSQIRGLLLRG